MRAAGEGRLHPVLHVLHVEELALGADRVRQRAGARGEQRVLPAELLREHAGHPHEYLAARRAGGVRHAGSCSPRRCRPTYGIYSGFEHFENVPVARGLARSTSTPRSTRCSERELDGPLLPLDQRAQRDPAREPGAAAPRQRRASSRPRTTRSSPTPSARAATWSSASSTSIRTARRRACAIVPSELGLPPVFAVERPAHRASASTGASGATTCAWTRAAAGPRPARSSARDRPRQRPGHWFEANPLWFKTAVFYEIHMRGFFDGNGDGSGDFRGLTEKLDYLQWLGRRLHLAAAVVRVAAARRRLRHRRLLSRSTPTTGRSTTSATSSRRPTSAASA